MQQSMPRQQPNSAGSQVQTMIITAITLFALSGLMVGFAFGAFSRPHNTQNQQGNNGHNNTPVAHTTPTPSPTATPQPTGVGIPHVTAPAFIEMSDGKTAYTVEAYPIDKQQGQQIHANDITCKIWLTKDTDTNDITHKLSDNSYSALKSIDTIKQPLPTDDGNNPLVFSNGQQTQLCNANGNTTWTYTVSPNADPGDYILVILTDWKGQFYNWAYEAVTIKKPS